MDILRLGGDLEDEHVDRLLSLHLDSIERKHGKEKVREIKKDAVFLFFKNEKRVRHNFEMLKEECTEENPAAMITPICTSTVSAMRGIKSHFSTETPDTTFICTNAKVALDNRNIYPRWGLHNGACGTADEILYQKGHNPNHGNLPRYAVVRFPLYSGPIWDRNDRTAVPIPVSQTRCRKMCCVRNFLPLTLAYARTIHKFQGLSAGPTKEGRPENAYKCIVCDPDEKKWERSALGLLYTAVSRATTLGDDDGLGSAIYFFGRDFKESRVRNMHKKKNSMDDFVAVIKRDKWVRHLRRNTVIPSADKARIDRVAKYLNRTTWDVGKLLDRIDAYKATKSSGHARTARKRKRKRAQ